MTKEKILKKKIAIVTMGCDKNTVDSERIAFKLKEAGFEIIADLDNAQIVIVNTCAFLQSAREENINKIFKKNLILIAAMLKSPCKCIGLINFVYATYIKFILS